MPDFKDYFSKQASSYVAYRPKSPPQLFEFLFSLCPTRELAWDVGTGNGQAAVDLARAFRQVIATDPSAEQLRHAVPHANVQYRLAAAEVGIPEKADLITVAQALHWFDFEKFYAQVRRVGKPAAIVAAWTYDLATVTPEIDDVVAQYYNGEVKRFWAPERRYVDEHYLTIPFPFEEIKTSPFFMDEPRTLAECVGYYYSWSATQKGIREVGPSLFEAFVTKLEKVWGDPREPRRVRWPLYLRVGRVGG